MHNAPSAPIALKPIPLEPIVPLASTQPALQQPGKTPLNLEQAMALAMRLQRDGQWQKAQEVLQQILQGNATFPPALHLLGLVLHQAGKTAEAIEWIGRALEGAPKESLFHSNKGEMCRLLGRLEEAVCHGLQAVELSPQSATAHSNLGITYFDQKLFEQAEACQQRALAIDPACASALNNLGSICRERKDVEAAIDFYKKAVAGNPQYFEAANNWAAMLVESDRHAEALPILLNVIKQRPQYAEAHSNLGNAFVGLGQLDQAYAAYQNVIKFQGNLARAHAGMAKVFMEKNRLPQAKNAIITALRYDAEKPDLHCILGTLHLEMNFPEEASACYEKALLLDPDCVAAYLGKGNLQMEMGQLQAAEAAFNHVLTLEANSLAACTSLAQLKKSQANDRHVACLEKHAENVLALPYGKAIPLRFALGKMYEDMGDYTKAFSHFEAGCRLKRGTLDYQVSDACNEMHAMRDFFNEKTIARLRGAGVASDLPIFVLGMPRSGTTLTEQIIASHSAVFGAGELPVLLDMAFEHEGENLENTATFKRSSIFPEKIKSYRAQDLTAWGERYIQALQVKAPHARRITDKMPANFLFIGLIHCMLPHAKIIHVNRNPVDTCVSNFCRLFNRTQWHSYDLREMGQYYSAYHKLMAHWRAVLPADAFLDIQYEDLVSNNETQARRMMDFCGLEWEPACLEFYKTQRKIHTASVTQVREPIYHSSVQKWRHYEPFLGSLLDELGELVA